jgi:pantoate--beta-alanine ligase
MMIVRTIGEMNRISLELRSQNKTIGFVPTMGALHKGHINLIEQSVRENDATVCSIFVNPIQFNNPADLEKYPRNLEKDKTLLEQAGCHIIFHPEVEEMYPGPVNKTFDFGLSGEVMEGRFRPGHFNGVAVVVEKLFNIVLPHRAYFGEKDFQQLAIVKAMVKQEGLPVEIVPHPTVREEDGLAMSSRNQRLTPEQRREAPLIHRVLMQAGIICRNESLQAARQYAEETISANPQMQLEYFEISDSETLQPLTDPVSNRQAVACIAVFMGSVRLIDNMVYSL